MLAAVDSSSKYALSRRRQAEKYLQNCSGAPRVSQQSTCSALQHSKKQRVSLKSRVKTSLRMNDTKRIVQTFGVFPTKTTGLNTRYSFEADDAQSTREPLSGLCFQFVKRPGKSHLALDGKKRRWSSRLALMPRKGRLSQSRQEGTRC